MKKTNKNFRKIHDKIISLGPLIIEQVTAAINNEIGHKGTLNDYKVVWSQLQDIASPKKKF